MDKNVSLADSKARDMKPFYLSLLLLSLNMTGHTQQKYTIHGKIDRLTKSKIIKIGVNQAPINDDGSFEISGEIQTPHMEMINTDSSYADALNGIWLEAGNYTLKGQEVSWGGNQHGFQPIVTDGPRDAKQISDFASQFPWIESGQGKAGSIRYFDSVYHQANPVIQASLILKAQFSLGDTIAERYLASVNIDGIEGYQKQLVQDLKRDIKIRKEKYFEDFSMPTAEGGNFRLSTIKGKKAIILDFWSSSCAPCRARHPKMIALYEKYKSQGLEIVSISLDDDRDVWLKAIEKDKIGTWINVSDLHGFGSPLTKDYIIPMIPWHFLLDGEGKIIKVYPAGGLPEADVLGLLTAAK